MKGVGYRHDHFLVVGGQADHVIFLQEPDRYRFRQRRAVGVIVRYHQRTTADIRQDLGRVALGDHAQLHQHLRDAGIIGLGRQLLGAVDFRFPQLAAHNQFLREPLVAGRGFRGSRSRGIVLEFSSQGGVSGDSG